MFFSLYFLKFLHYLKWMFDHQLWAHILMVKIPLVLTKSCDLDTGNALLAKLGQREIGIIKNSELILIQFVHN